MDEIVNIHESAVEYQELKKAQLVSMHMSPKMLEEPVSDPLKDKKRPIGILNVNVIRATKLKRMTFLGASDPYVELRLTEVRSIPYKTYVKHKSLNPEWNKDFNLYVIDPDVQVLEILVRNWKKYGIHDRMGMSVVPLKDLTNEKRKRVTLDLLAYMDSSNSQKKKSQGQITVEMLYKPLIDDTIPIDFPVPYRKPPTGTPKGGGLLIVVIHEGANLEGKYHTNPSVSVVFQGKLRKTKPMKKNQEPRWEEEFEFTLAKSPTNDILHLEVVSTSWIKLTHPKESLGYVDISLADVVNYKRINEKYNLIDSKNGRLQVELLWIDA